jgi:hypothetical protein
MVQGLSSQTTVHLLLQVQVQMKSAGAAFYAYDKAVIFWG